MDKILQVAAGKTEQEKIAIKKNYLCNLSCAWTNSKGNSECPSAIPPAMGKRKWYGKVRRSLRCAKEKLVRTFCNKHHK